MRNFIILISLLFLSPTIFSQENKATEKALNINSNKAELIFDFSEAKDKKEAKNMYFDNLSTFIYNNLDTETLNYFSSNLRKKDSSYTLRFTYYRNKKGKIITDLVGSNLKRTNYEAHKKLAFLLSKSTLKKQKYSVPLKSRQDFVTMRFKKDSVTSDLHLLPYEKRDRFKFNPIDSLTAPVYKSCNSLEDTYSQKTYKTVKRCMAFQISNLISENFNKEIQKKAAVIVAKKYGIYDKKIKTIAKFIFDKEGKVTNIETLGLVPEIEDEVTRILRQIPDAQPGTKKGKPAPVTYSVPVIIKTIER